MLIFFYLYLSPCVYSYLRRRLSDNFIPLQKSQPMGRMSIEQRGLAVGLIDNGVSLRPVRNLS